MLRLLFMEAFSAILANRSRTILTLLGVVIGIASVTTVIAAGNGGKSIIMREFEGLSPTTLQIMPNWQVYSGNRSYRFETMTERDLDALEELYPLVQSVAPLQSSTTIVKVGRTERSLAVTGTNSNYIDFVEYELESGRLATPEEVRALAKVAIVGHAIKEEFFPDSDPLGQYLTAFDTPIRIIGVLQEKERAATISLSDTDSTFNRAIVVPIGLFRRLSTAQQGFYDVLCRARSVQEIPQARSAILAALDRDHGKWAGGESKFMVTAMKEQVDMINSVIGSVTAGVAVLAGIALLVAAIGIMNIMLVSVKERTREIGLRKAIGARQGQIMAQFLIETLLLCGGGGLIGFAVATGAAALIAALAKWPAVVSYGTAALSLSLALATGLASGLYPASRAAGLVPHEALRYE